jgi:branched-chain amino acid transport system substrate-binding protein
MKQSNGKRHTRPSGSAVRLLVGAAAVCAAGLAHADTFKIGVISLLSGPAAESFGTPNVNAARLLADKLNKGEGPGVYKTKGIGGMPIELVLVDEAAGATKVLDGYRSLVQRDKVDAVIGPIASGNCLAVAPVAEQLKTFTILSDCGTPRVFEEGTYQYVFRAGAHGAMDNVALAKYLVDEKVPMKTLSSIQPDYAYGRDAWTDFKGALDVLAPDAQIKGELWPKFGAGQYGAEISALIRDRSDVIHSSLWGGDLQAFILQAAPRGLLQNGRLALMAAAHVLPYMGDKMPDGVIMGERGAVGPFARPGPLNDWFARSYRDTYNQDPASASAYRMAQSLLGLKLAAEKVMSANGGKKPTAEELSKAMEGLEWDTPSGRIRMALGKGHQAIQDAAIGVTRWDPGKKAVTLVKVRYYDAQCINPPEGVKSVDWLKTSFKKSTCN